SPAVFALLISARYGDHLALHSFPTRRSSDLGLLEHADELAADDLALLLGVGDAGQRVEEAFPRVDGHEVDPGGGDEVLLDLGARSEEHTSELQSRVDLVCRLLLEKKKTCLSE